MALEDTQAVAGMQVVALAAVPADYTLAPVVVTATAPEQEQPAVSPLG